MAAVESMRGTGYDGPLVVLDPSETLPHDRPPLTKQVLSGEWPLERAEQPVAARLASLDLDLRLGVGAAGLDAKRRSLALSDGTTLDASAVLVATGSHARRLPLSRQGEPGAGTFVVRTGADSVALRDRLEHTDGPVVVIGAGFIGAEVAATCRRLGFEVTILEAAPVPLQRVLPGDVGSFVADLHRAHGVDVRLGTVIEAIETGADGSPHGVRLADGSLIEAAVVVEGVGAAPSVAWLEGSGLELLEPARGGGVLCDASLLAHPGVVAAGDLAAWPNPHFGGEVMRVEHWENAIESGTHAGRRVLAEVEGSSLGNNDPFDSLPWFWSDQYDAKIQMVGRSGPDDEAVFVDGEPGSERFVVLFRRAGRCSAALGVGRPRLVMQARMKMAESLDWDGVAALF